MEAVRTAWWITAAVGGGVGSHLQTLCHLLHCLREGGEMDVWCERGTQDRAAARQRVEKRGGVGVACARPRPRPPVSEPACSSGVVPGPLGRCSTVSRAAAGKGPASPPGRACRNSGCAGSRAHTWQMETRSGQGGRLNWIPQGPPRPWGRRAWPAPAPPPVSARASTHQPAPTSSSTICSPGSLIPSIRSSSSVPFAALTCGVEAGAK